MVLLNADKIPIERTIKDMLPREIGYTFVDALKIGPDGTVYLHLLNPVRSDQDISNSFVLYVRRNSWEIGDYDVDPLTVATPTTPEEDGYRWQVWSDQKRIDGILAVHKKKRK